MDDLLCFSKDTASHISTLRTMLTRLRQGGLKISPEKSTFLQTELEYLGSSISEDGVRPTLDKASKASRLTHIIPGRAPEAKYGQFGYYQLVFLSSSSYSVRWDSVKFTNK